MKDHVKLYLDISGNWRWRFIAANGLVLANSGQGYSRRIDCITAAKHVTGSDKFFGRSVRFIIEGEDTQ